LADARLVPCALIDPNPYQPRGHIEEAELEELASSIRAVGVLEPLLVRPHAGRYQLIAGERRWRAAGLVGLARVPCLVRETSDEEAELLALVENLQRRDMAPIDEAQAYARMRDRGLSQRQIAGMVHKSAAHVNGRLRLLAEPDIATAVGAGALPPTVARAMLRARKGRRRAAGEVSAAGHASVAPAPGVNDEPQEPDQAGGEYRPAGDPPARPSAGELIDLADSRTATLLRLGGKIHVEEARAALEADLQWLRGLRPPPP
jgi:ParB family chromosome partitioning protein